MKYLDIGAKIAFDTFETFIKILKYKFKKLR